MLRRYNTACFTTEETLTYENCKPTDFYKNKKEGDFFSDEIYGILK